MTVALILMCIGGAVYGGGSREAAVPIPELFAEIVALEHFVLIEAEHEEGHEHEEHEDHQEYEEGHEHEEHDEHDAHDEHHEHGHKTIALHGEALNEVDRRVDELETLVNEIAEIGTERGAIEYTAELIEFIDHIHGYVRGEVDEGEGHDHSHDHDHDHGHGHVSAEGPFQNALLTLVELEGVLDTKTTSALTSLMETAAAMPDTLDDEDHHHEAHVGAIQVEFLAGLVESFYDNDSAAEPAVQLHEAFHPIDPDSYAAALRRIRDL